MSMTYGDFMRYAANAGLVPGNAGGGGSGGTAMSAFFVVPNGYSGTVPSGYTQVTQNNSNVGAVALAAGVNLVQIAAGCVGTVNVTANAQPFTVDIFGAGLSSVTVNRVNAS